MNGIADPEDTPAEGSPEEYFRALEEVFIRLRGAPLLLSPTDFQTARSWHEQRIPIELVSRVMEEVFARLRERNPERKIHSLRYCASAVEDAWREVRDLGAAEGRAEPEPIDVAARLRDLVDRLPPDLPDRASVARDIQAVEGEAEEIEAELQAIQDRLLTAAIGVLDERTREQIDERVDRALSRARSRVAASELSELETRLRSEYTRQHLSLPILSLFAEAEPGS